MGTVLFRYKISSPIGDRSGWEGETTDSSYFCKVNLEDNSGNTYKDSIAFL